MCRICLSFFLSSEKNPSNLTPFLAKYLSDLIVAHCVYGLRQCVNLGRCRLERNMLHLPGHQEQKTSIRKLNHSLVLQRLKICFRRY
jgi:hypothetical protein